MRSAIIPLLGVEKVQGKAEKPTSRGAGKQGNAGGVAAATTISQQEGWRVVRDGYCKHTRATLVPHRQSVTLLPR